MRLAVISDIHGNATALDAVLADLERHPADALVCLGDCIQGGAQPELVVARLRALRCPVVMGNADAWLLSGVETGTENASDEQRAILADVRRWSLSRLSAADREFIAAFTPTVSLEVGGRSFLGYHGSPGSFDDILMPDMPRERFESLLGAHAADFMAGGHVHLQFARTFTRSTHFNPGSVGAAYDRTAPESQWRLRRRAEYAVLEAEGSRLGLEFRQVPYDANAYLAAMGASGRPHAEMAIAQFEPESAPARGP
jgi:predicted phosphodiesterase